MYDTVTNYQNSKMKRWIDHQLAQRMLVYFWTDENRLFVIKKATDKDGQLVVINGDQKETIQNQMVYSTYKDITKPVGTCERKPLDVSEYVALICECIW